MSSSRTAARAMDMSVCGQFKCQSLRQQWSRMHASPWLFDWVRNRLPSKILLLALLPHCLASCRQSPLAGQQKFASLITRTMSSWRNAAIFNSPTLAWLSVMLSASPSVKTERKRYQQVKCRIFDEEVEEDENLWLSLLLLPIITSVITSLLPIITVPLLPIITVIMGSLLPIITRSIIGNNGFIITYYWPGQLGDVRLRSTSSLTFRSVLRE